jgi:hypothetical protein
MRIFLGLTYDTPDWLNIHTDLSITKQTNKYSLQSALDNTSYYVNISPVITFKPGKNTEINIDEDYRRTTASTTRFNSMVNMLNVNITQYLNHEKNISLVLKGVNLLDQTANIWQVYGDNFIQNLETTNLSRYFLLTVNFRLNKTQK